jgi:predicted  nucleic acid-binding Zn-ribbon protein
VKIEEQIDALEALAAIDSELDELGSELGRQREALTGKKQQLGELDEKIERDRQSLVEMERLRGELMQELRQMGAQIEKSREKLSRCRTEREANAAQREIEELRKLYRDREIEIEKLAGLIDQAKSDIEVESGQRDEIRSELGNTEGAVTTRLGEVEERLSERGEARKLAVTRLPVALYRRYENVRKRRRRAVAFTEEGTCSECHVRLTPMLFQQLLRFQELATCPSCLRIIYLRRPQAEGPDVDDGGGENATDGL